MLIMYIRRVSCVDRRRRRVDEEVYMYNVYYIVYIYLQTTIYIIHILCPRRNHILYIMYNVYMADEYFHLSTYNDDRDISLERF